MASNPELIPDYVSPAEVLKDRALRLQFNNFPPRLALLAAKAQDTYDVVGNEIMLADLAYYGSIGDAAKRGITSAGDIHDDLATWYPGRPSAETPQPPAKEVLPVGSEGLIEGNAAVAEGQIDLGDGCFGG